MYREIDEESERRVERDDKSMSEGEYALMQKWKVSCSRPLEGAVRRNSAMETKWDQGRIAEAAAVPSMRARRVICLRQVKLERLNGSMAAATCEPKLSKDGRLYIHPRSM